MSWNELRKNVRDLVEKDDCKRLMLKKVRKIVLYHCRYRIVLLNSFYSVVLPFA
jgi:hypothetical protein